MFKDSSATYYQKEKKATKKACVSIKIFPKKKREKKHRNLDTNDVKFSLKMKNKDWLSEGKLVLRS